MTDNSKDLEKQKAEFLDALWKQIQGQTNWKHEDYVKNDLLAKLQLRNLPKKTPNDTYIGSPGFSNINVEIEREYLKKGFIKVETNPLKENPKNEFSGVPTSPDFNGANTIRLLQNAIVEADKSGATDITQWTENFGKSLDNQYNIPSVYTNNNDVRYNKKAIETSRNFASKENVEQMFKKEEPKKEEPKKGFSTTSKDHKVRIEQWMAHVGIEGKSQEIIDKYGLENAYAIVQKAMLAPADLSSATDGKYRGSRATISYFLENDIPDSKLAEIPGVKIEPKVMDTQMEGLNVEVPETTIPESISLPPLNYGLSNEDATKVKFASTMRDVVSVDGYSSDEVQKACDKAFSDCIKDKNLGSDMDEWTLAFTNKLVSNLGIASKVNGDNEEYMRLIAPIFGVRDGISTTLSNGTELSANQEYLTIAKRENTKREMASEKGGIEETTENASKTERVAKRYNIKEAYRSGLDRVNKYFAPKKEVKETPSKDETLTIEPVATITKTINTPEGR